MCAYKCTTCVVTVCVIHLICACVCVLRHIFMRLSDCLCNEETSFLNSAGNVSPNYIHKVQVILVFITRRHLWLLSFSASALTYTTHTDEHIRTPTCHFQVTRVWTASDHSSFFGFEQILTYISELYTIQHIYIYINFLILIGLS